MILSKTPLRISFAGGGSDYFNKKSNTPGRVISTTINKYIYILLNNKHDGKIRISYSQTENVDTANDINHVIIKNSLKYFNIYRGVEIITSADVPSSGSGLGSSSALTVGLVNAINKFLINKKIGKKLLSKQACEIEIQKCRKPIGMQDQVSTAYGGLNTIIFKKNKSVTIKKIKISKLRKKNFENNLMLFYSGINRSADHILGSIKKRGRKFINFEKLSNLAKNFEYELTSGNLDNLGHILHENWMIKKDLDIKVSPVNINQIYEDALGAGAIGGKLLGAGGGGYFLFFVKHENQKKVKKRLSKLQCINFRFTDTGSKSIKI